TELEGNTTTYTIAYTFGWEPLQQYLIKFPDGNYQTLRASWDTQKKKWFHQYPDTIIPTSDWLHWTGNAQVWNSMCASCHSTNLKKNFTETTRTYNTTYDVMNVSCEACHGPGSKHVAVMQIKNYTGNTYYTRLDKSSKDMQINVCGTCHGRRTALTANSNPQTDFLEFYYPDGQQLDEVYNYGSFLSSKMYRYGVVCTDCHNPHSGKIKLEGNALCLQCHAVEYDSPAHHFHAEKTAGAQCKSCHMDGRNYMVNDYRHDHSFRVPRPDQSVKYNTPNACISCHENKTNSWAAEAIRKWYGAERKYHFSDDLIPGSFANGNSLAHLQRLMADTAVNAIVKATALTYMSYLPEPKALDNIIAATTHPSALVRTNAFISLLNYRQNTDVSILTKGLTDPVRSVRIAAYRVLANPAITKIEDAYLAAYTSVQSEYLAYLDANADFAAGQILKGEYYQEINDLQTAEKCYLNALALDKLLEAPRLNLAIIYSKQQRNAKTWEQLQLLIQYHPQ
ncbi:MAG: cytochrome c3 family protein, partial [Chitinophagales bacterium]